MCSQKVFLPNVLTNFLTVDAHVFYCEDGRNQNRFSLPRQYSKTRNLWNIIIFPLPAKEVMHGLKYLWFSKNTEVCSFSKSVLYVHFAGKRSIFDTFMSGISSMLFVWVHFKASEIEGEYDRKNVSYGHLKSLSGAYSTHLLKLR